MGKSLNRMTQKLVDVPQKAADYWVKITPIDTGNAKRKTKLKGKHTIHAQYHYASYLDNGHSKQAPRGMLRPTKAFVARLIKQIMRK